MPPSMPGQHALSAVGAVLAGGAGRRFGSALPPGGKGFLMLHGQPLVDHAARFLARQNTGPVVVNLNPPHPPLAADRPVAADGAYAGCGPLAGLLTVLEWAAAHCPARPWVLTVAVDTPVLPTDLLARLAPAAAPVQAAIAAAPGRLHPTIGLWRSTLRVPLAAALGQGTRALRDWLALIEHQVVVWPAPGLFANINTPDDLAAAERQAQSTGATRECSNVLK